MTAVKVSSGVLLSGPELVTCWKVLAWRIRKARRDGEPVPLRLLDLERTLAAEAEAASLEGQALATGAPALTALPEDLIGTATASRMLGVSARTVGHGRDELGARPVAGRLTFDKGDHRRRSTGKRKQMKEAGLSRAESIQMLIDAGFEFVGPLPEGVKVKPGTVTAKHAAAAKDAAIAPGLTVNPSRSAADLAPMNDPWTGRDAEATIANAKISERRTLCTCTPPKERHGWRSRQREPIKAGPSPSA